VETLAVILKK